MGVSNLCEIVLRSKARYGMFVIRGRGIIWGTWLKGLGFLRWGAAVGGRCSLWIAQPRYVTEAFLPSPESLGKSGAVLPDISPGLVLFVSNCEKSNIWFRGLLRSVGCHFVIIILLKLILESWEDWRGCHHDAAVVYYYNVHMLNFF